MRCRDDMPAYVTIYVDVELVTFASTPWVVDDGESESTSPKGVTAMGAEERQWPFAVVFTEDDRTTRAEVVLDVAGRRYHEWGSARRSPTDPDVPRIGQEVAASRALSRLARDLLSDAGDDISELEHRPVRLHG
jgi:hypothetical protein